jgi:hypothetical protein
VVAPKSKVDVMFVLKSLSHLVALALVSAVSLAGCAVDANSAQETEEGALLVPSQAEKYKGAVKRLQTEVGLANKNPLNNAKYAFSLVTYPKNMKKETASILAEHAKLKHAGNTQGAFERIVPEKNDEDPIGKVGTAIKLLREELDKPDEYVFGNLAFSFETPFQALNRNGNKVTIYTHFEQNKKGQPTLISGVVVGENNEDGSKLVFSVVRKKK